MHSTPAWLLPVSKAGSSEHYLPTDANMCTYIEQGVHPLRLPPGIARLIAAFLRPMFIVITNQFRDPIPVFDLFASTESKWINMRTYGFPTHVPTSRKYPRMYHDIRNTTMMMNLENHTYKPIAPMPRPRQDHVLVRIQQCVFAIGGTKSYQKDDGEMVNIACLECDMFDLNTMRWCSVAHMKLAYCKPRCTGVVVKSRISPWST